mmetsp:Transcript_4875/g.12551  ORF Transcript_4875/g.12551 Transcript_4875/m.12551 type:complete len:272 (+) Transcript_4875:570-1385(+)
MRPLDDSIANHLRLDRLNVPADRFTIQHPLSCGPATRGTGTRPSSSSGTGTLCEKLGVGGGPAVPAAAPAAPPPPSSSSSDPIGVTTGDVIGEVIGEGGTASMGLGSKSSSSFSTSLAFGNTSVDLRRVRADLGFPAGTVPVGDTASDSVCCRRMTTSLSSSSVSSSNFSSSASSSASSFAALARAATSSGCRSLSSSGRALRLCSRYWRCGEVVSPFIKTSGTADGPVGTPSVTPTWLPIGLALAIAASLSHLDSIEARAVCRSAFSDWI